MSDKLHLIDYIAQELREIGVPPLDVRVVPLPGSADTFVVSILSDSLDGQTFLDRELRVRPAVARAFGRANLPRATYVLEAQTSDELALEEGIENSGEYIVPDADAAADQINRRRWREQCEAVKRALSGAHYQLESMEAGRVIIARKEQLSREAILVAFANNPSVETVDFELRKVMQALRSTISLNKAFYLSPKRLLNPFANQTKVDWIDLQTSNQFLHALNSSNRLAEAVKSDAEKRMDKGSADRVGGPAIEPAVRIGEGQMRVTANFFDFVQGWSSGEDASLLVLIAPAGHGKTTLSLELARQAAERFLGAPESNPVPLFVPFEAVRRTVDFESIVHKANSDLGGGSFSAFKELLKADQAVLFVDGFDELADDAGIGVAEAQVRSMRGLLSGRAKVVLAGRTIFAEMFAGGATISGRVQSLLGTVPVQVVEILPFDAERIHRFVETRSSLDNVARGKLFEFSEATKDHAEICANPLFLKILCSLALDGKLPSGEEMTTGVDAVVDKVCQREEVRQHLGIGLDRQLEFLGWMANELFRQGTLGLPKGDAEAISLAVAEAAGQAKDVSERLQDHALLAPRGVGVGFLHPYIRDVLLGRYLLQHRHESEGRASAPLSLLGLRDLPEATIAYMAQKPLADLPLPDHWLTVASKLPSRSRRNLVRIALQRRFYQDGDPRSWLAADWVKDKTVAELDLSGLLLDSLDLGGIEFLGCDFSRTIIEDCDLRGAKLVDCRFEATIFDEVVADSATEVRGGFAKNVDVRKGGQRFGADSATEVAGILRPSVAETGVVRAPDPKAARDCRGFIRKMLSQLVEVEPSIRFHSVNRIAFETLAKTREEKLALEKAIYPLLLNRVCETVLSGGSKENIDIVKSWRQPVLNYLVANRLTPPLADLLNRAVARGAKYFA